MAEYVFKVNGITRSTTEDKPLLRYLRDDLNLKSVKDGCSEGACGTCTVLIDGKRHQGLRPHRPGQAGGRKSVITVEGLSDFEKQVYTYAFGMAGAVQCGFCIPGMVMSRQGDCMDTDSRSHPGGGGLRHPQQHLPLHRLQEDNRGHHPRGRHPARRR